MQLHYCIQKLTITVVHKMFSIAEVQTKVINSSSANKSCLLQVVHKKAIAALTQFCDFLNTVLPKTPVRVWKAGAHWPPRLVLALESVPNSHPNRIRLFRWRCPLLIFLCNLWCEILWFNFEKCILSSKLWIKSEG